MLFGSQVAGLKTVTSANCCEVRGCQDFVMKRELWEAMEAEAYISFLIHRRILISYLRFRGEQLSPQIVGNVGIDGYVGIVGIVGIDGYFFWTHLSPHKRTPMPESCVHQIKITCGRDYAQATQEQ